MLKTRRLAIFKTSLSCFRLSTCFLYSSNLYTLHLRAIQFNLGIFCRWVVLFKWKNDIVDDIVLFFSWKLILTLFAVFGPKVSLKISQGVYFFSVCDKFERTFLNCNYSTLGIEVLVKPFMNLFCEYLQVKKITTLQPAVFSKTSAFAIYKKEVRFQYFFL